MTFAIEFKYIRIGKGMILFTTLDSRILRDPQFEMLGGKTDGDVEEEEEEQGEKIFQRSWSFLAYSPIDQLINL